MKKLKRFALNDARMFSREELAAIEGGLTITALDNCTLYTRGQACVYHMDSYGGGNGHTTVIIGTCEIKYEQVGTGNKFTATPFCA